MRLLRAIPFVCALSILGVSACGPSHEAVADNAAQSARTLSNEGTLVDETLGDPVWQTVFFDDFDDAVLDRTKWKPEVSCWGGGNNERQCYTDRSENIEIKEGRLRLIAKEEAYTGPKFPEGLPGAPGGEQAQAYTSGKIRTRGLAYYKYGRVSARIKVPAGQGTWPAFWMMPQDEVYGPWPLSGEIDIMEAINQETPCEDCPGGIERRTSAALHFGGPPPGNTYWFKKAGGEGDAGPSSEFRVYALEWGKETMQWLVDGEVILRIGHEDWYTDAPAGKGNPYAPFDQEFYVMLNLAVGGNLAEKFNGGGFDPASFPAELHVDWVRIEQCKDDLETGMSCLTDQAWDGEPEGPWETQAR